MNALIEFAGKQYTIAEGSVIKVPYINGKVGSKVTIDKILYMDDGENKNIGTPLVNGIKITGEIESHGRERKVVVFKFKRRKGYQKKNTHRQDFTILKFGKLVSIKKTGDAKKATTLTKKNIVDKKESTKNTTTKKVKKSTVNKKEKE